ncbi:hypothetical protein ABW19_dt0203326 [Dactylella cylindrospora]|nr:hypothetical protein ABW19_dt0203326 [Dactylella cylindrospora]
MAEPETFFDTLKLSFKGVTITSDGVNTTEFLTASESLVTLFDLLGAAAFGPVKSDMNGNIKKIRDRQNEALAVSTTLQQLVLAERAEKKKTATEGLLWLLRGLDFTAKALRHNVDNPTEELTTSFNHSYEGTLKKHHNFIVKGIFSVALKATPYRSDFMVKLGGVDDKSAAKVNKQLTDWLEALENAVGILQKFYEETPATKF